MPVVPREIEKGHQKTKKATDAPCFGVTEGPPDNHLVYALGKAGLEVTSKGVEGDKVREWSQQLEPQVVEPREEKHYSARGSGNPFSLNRDSLGIETYLGRCLKNVKETLHLEYSKGKNIRAGFLSDIDSSPG